MEQVFKFYYSRSHSTSVSRHTQAGWSPQLRLSHGQVAPRPAAAGLALHSHKEAIISKAAGMTRRTGTAEKTLVITIFIPSVPPVLSILGHPFIYFYYYLFLEKHNMESNLK